MIRIKHISYLLSLFFQVLCWATPLVTTYLILFDIKSMSNLGIWPSIIANIDTFSLLHRLVLLAVEALPMSITLLIFFKLKLLFKLYEQGSYFEEKNVTLIGGIGMCVISRQIIQLIYQPLLTTGLTFENPIVEHYANITIGTVNTSALIAGFIIIIISWIIQEVIQLKADSHLTI